MGKRTNKVDEGKLASRTDIGDLADTHSTADALGGDTDSTAEATEIRSTIEQTRAEMSETIDALQEKLNPERIAAQVKEKVKETAGEAVDAAKESVRDATIGRAERMVTNVADRFSDMTGISRRELRDSGSSVVDYVSSRPLAFAMLGIGFSMLAFGRGRNDERRYGNYGRYRSASRERDYTEPYGSRLGMYGGAEEYDAGRYPGSDYRGDRYREDEREGTSRRTSHVNDVGDSGSIAGGTREAVSSAASTVKEKAGDVADYAREVPGQVRSQARMASYRVQNTIDENPMIAGIAAFAIGAILGVALPETEAENRYMGEASEEFSERAKSVAKKTTETVQRVAKETAETLKEEGQVSLDTTKRAVEDAGREIKTDLAQNLESNNPFGATPHIKS